MEVGHKYSKMSEPWNIVGLGRSFRSSYGLNDRSLWEAVMCLSSNLMRLLNNLMCSSCNLEKEMVSTSHEPLHYWGYLQALVGDGKSLCCASRYLQVVLVIDYYRTLQRWPTKRIRGASYKWHVVYQHPRIVEIVLQLYQALVLAIGLANCLAKLSVALAKEFYVELSRENVSSSNCLYPCDMRLQLRAERPEYESQIRAEVTDSGNIGRKLKKLKSSLKSTDVFFDGFRVTADDNEVYKRARFF